MQPVCWLLQRVHTNGPNHPRTVSQLHITVFTKRLLLDFSTDVIPNPSDSVQTQKTLPLYPSWHCVSVARVLPWLPGGECLVKITLMASLCQSSPGASECFHRHYGYPQGKWSSRANSAEFFWILLCSTFVRRGVYLWKENPRYWRSPQHHSAAESFIPNKSGWLTLLRVTWGHQSNLWQANGEYYLSVFRKFPWKTSQRERAIIRTTFDAAAPPWSSSSREADRNIHLHARTLCLTSLYLMSFIHPDPFPESCQLFLSSSSSSVSHSAPRRLLLEMRVSGGAHSSHSPGHPLQYVQASLRVCPVWSHASCTAMLTNAGKRNLYNLGS